MSEPTYWQDVRKVARCMAPGPVDLSLWGDVLDELGWVARPMRDLLISLLFVVLRIAMQLAFPVSIWAGVWLVRHDRAKVNRILANHDRLKAARAAEEVKDPSQ